MSVHEIALHEAAHLIIYIRLGGQYKPGSYARINAGSGVVSVPVLSDYEYGYLLEACVLAAGIACDEITGHQSYEGRGSDTDKLQDLYLNECDRSLIVSKVRVWLEQNWQLVEDISGYFLQNRITTSGSLSRRVVLNAVRDIKDRVSWRKLSRKRSGARKSYRKAFYCAQSALKTRFST